jgi:hypothetical protein
MPAGIEHFNDAGRLVFSSEDGQTTYVLKRSGQVACVASSWGFQSVSMFDVNFSDVPNAIVAISGGNGYLAALWVSSSGFKQYLSDAPVGTVFNYFVFVNVNIYPVSEKFGIEAYNSAGQLTFSSTAYTMRTLNVITVGGGLPAYTGPQSYPGKQLAFSHGVYSGKNIHFNMDPDSGGVMYDQIWDANGFSIGGGGSFIGFGAVPYVNGRFGPTPESFIGPDFYVGAIVLLLNVTNVPIGVTVF